MESHLKGWIGSTEQQTDVIDRWRVDALAATLEVEPSPTAGSGELPPLWHWVFFVTPTPRSQLGPDGHPKRGGFLPAVPLRRRMYAGGRIEFLRPLTVGTKAVRSGEVVAVEQKEGRTGPLVFVTVRHRITVDGRTAIRETQEIVYTDAVPAARRDASDEPPEAPWARLMHPDEALLFRFSALTFNSHRIHYDLDYAREVEGYRSLVVHGPLLAILLAELARSNGYQHPKMFECRGRAPVYVGDPIHLRGRPDDVGGAWLAAYTPDGRIGMEATWR
ncbi:MAG: FAS1-like dehydratase domain-containing protein [Acidimicrobiia bacterium]